MKVFLLYDHHDLVDIFETYEAADKAAEPSRKSSIWAVGHDQGVEIVECEVKK